LDLDRVIVEVPEYDRFLTVDEMDASTRRLAEQHPEVVSLREVGRSRKGHPILCLRVGEGRYRALLFGCPHPNEPIGAMMLEYLSWRLAEDRDLRDGMDYTWYLIKCIDPDGTRLNEGWFGGPFTLHNYARHYYRPPLFQQVEWTFPITYKKLNWRDPMPETRALMRVMEEVRPHFIFSLHNAGFGGVYYYLSDPAPEIYPLLQGLARGHGLPLQLGEPEMPYAQKLAEAIYRMPSTRDTYEYLERYSERDPTEVITAGTSSVDYAKRLADTFALVCELPYFYDPRIDDQSPGTMRRSDAVLRSVELAAKFFCRLREHYDQVRDMVREDNPFRVSLEHQFQQVPHWLEAMRRWALEAPELQRTATVAEEFDNLLLTRFGHLLARGLYARMLEMELEDRTDDGGLKLRFRQALDELLREAETLEGELNYTVIPIKKLVTVQLASALYVARYVAEWGARTA